MFRPSFKFQCTLFAVLLVAISIPGGAAYALFKESEGLYYIGAEEVIDDNLFVIADTFEMNGEVRGDIIVAANRAHIKGRVNGDVIALASDLTIEGEVRGDIRSLTRTAKIASVVSGNATLVAEDISFVEGGEIGHSVTALGKSIAFEGPVVKHITAFVEHAVINTPVGGNLFIRLSNGGRVVVGEKARIGGDIHYVSKHELERKPGAEIAGVIRRIEPKPSPQGDFSFLFFLIGLVGTLSVFVAGLFIVNLFGKRLSEMSALMIEKPLDNLFRGFAYFFLLPIALFFIALTIVGIPLAFMLGALFLVAMYVSKVIAAFTVGRYVAERFIKKAGLHPVLILLLGVFATRVIQYIPYVGWFAGFLFLWWALGALMGAITLAVRRSPS